MFNLNIERHKIVQFVIAICVSFSTIGYGMNLTWTSPALPYLKSNNSEFVISEFQGSWITSTSDLGSAAGNLLNPIFSSLMGRKYCLAIATIFQVISWTLIVLANNIQTLYISRLINGFSCSFALNFAMMYMGEIADKNIRGILLLILRIGLQSGSLLVLITSAFLSYKLMNLIALFIPILFLLTFAFLPESPYYLLLNDRKEEAKKAIIKLRGSGNLEMIYSELNRIEKAAREAEERNKRWALWELFSMKGNRKSFTIMVLIEGTKILSGRLAINAYSQEIFSYSGFSFAPKYSAILYTVITITVLLVSTQIIDRAGRRITVLFSGIFSALGLGLVGTFFFIKYYLLSDIESITWLPLFGLIFYNIASTFGVGTLPYILSGEIYALHVKVTAVTCVATVGDLTNFLVQLLFPWMNNSLGIYTTFWIYALCSFTGTIIFFVITPETKGKSLEEIQDILHSRFEEKESNAI